MKVNGTPGQPWLGPILSIFSMVYGSIVRGRLWLYHQGWLKTSRLPCPVLSVGNMTVGGTGKTPITLWFAEQLRNQGLRVGILSRGYRRSSRDRCVLVSDGRRILVNPPAAGDEPFLMAKRCPQLVVAVGADRFRLGTWVLAQEEVDCFVLDDGFQHVALHRDQDVVLIDSSDTEGWRHLLPKGRLREPLTGLMRASTIIVTRCEVDQKIDELCQLQSVQDKPHINIVSSRFIVEGVVQPGNDRLHPREVLQGQRVVIFCGLANPSSFRKTVADLGVDVVDEVIFPDHHQYSQKDLYQVRQRGGRRVDGFVTSEKDLVKIESLWPPAQDLFAIRIGLQVGVGDLDSCVQQMVRQCQEVRSSTLLLDAESVASSKHH